MAVVALAALLGGVVLERLRQPAFVGYIFAAAICGVSVSWHMILVVPSLILVLLNAIWMALMASRAAMAPRVR